MGERSTPEDLRRRFLGPVRPQIGALSCLLSHVDQDRHIAVAAYDPNDAGGGAEILGVVRLIVAQDDRQGEFAIMVRSDLKGQGLGHGLMQEMLHWARERGLARVEGHVLPENKDMLRMVRTLGGRVLPTGPDFGTARVAFELPPPGDRCA